MAALSAASTVAISGGGPAGLLAAILLGRAGVHTTVIERAPTTDRWSNRSYSIVLNNRGQSALRIAGAFDAVKDAGTERRRICLWDSGGGMRAIPKEGGIVITRPLLVECLEGVAAGEANVTIRRGAGVSTVRRSEVPSEFRLELEDGSVVSASHVIGADGKWSKVRRSFPELEGRTAIRIEPSFGVHIMVPSVPEGWPTDGTHVVRPASPSETFYIIASPLPTGEMSVSMVCFDSTVEMHPWLRSPDHTTTETCGGDGGWEDEFSARPRVEGQDIDVDLVENLTKLLEEETPFFLLAIGRDALVTARINRRVSWLEMTPDGNGGGGGVSYATEDGGVVLIGDAAHAMTPSLGEGCNMSLESAAQLVSPFIVADGKDGVVQSMSADLLSKAFLDYGRSRPEEAQSIQQRSASSSRGKGKMT